MLSAEEKVNLGTKDLKKEQIGVESQKIMADYNFTGEFSCTLDTKNRLNVPSGIRKMISPDANNTLVFAPGFEKNTLILYPQDEWKILTNGFKQFKINDKAAQQFIRRFVGSAHTVTMDSQGRIMLPQRTLQLAQIKSDILFLGMVNKLEVWNPENYNAYTEASGLGLDDLLEEIDFPDNTLR